MHLRAQPAPTGANAVPSRLALEACRATAVERGVERRRGRRQSLQIELARARGDVGREGARLGISGPPKAADNVAELLKSLLAGRDDLETL